MTKMKGQHFKEKTMNKKTIVYWGFTGVASLALLGSGLANVAGAEEVVKNLTALGYPEYFPKILGIWKVLAAIALLAPGFAKVKEWAYAGVTFAMTGATFSHILAGDPIGAAIPPLFILALVAGSYFLRPAGRRIEAAGDDSAPVGGLATA